MYIAWKLLYISATSLCKQRGPVIRPGEAHRAPPCRPRRTRRGLTWTPSSSSSTWHWEALRHGCPRGPRTHCPSGPHRLKTSRCCTGRDGAGSRLRSAPCSRAGRPRLSDPHTPPWLPLWYQGRYQGQEMLAVVLGGVSGQQEYLSKVLLQTSSARGGGGAAPQQARPARPPAARSPPASRHGCPSHLPRTPLSCLVLRSSSAQPPRTPLWGLPQASPLPRALLAALVSLEAEPQYCWLPPGPSLSPPPSPRQRLCFRAAPPAPAGSSELAGNTALHGSEPRWRRAPCPPRQAPCPLPTLLEPAPRGARSTRTKGSITKHCGAGAGLPFLEHPGLRPRAGH